jgi:hypothetical protein
VGEEGSTGPTPGRVSRRFSRVETSRRAGLVRIGTQSTVAWRHHMYVGRARRIRVGGALVQFLRGFRARIPRGSAPFNRWFWVPLIRYPTYLNVTEVLMVLSMNWNSLVGKSFVMVFFLKVFRSARRRL